MSQSAQPSLVNSIATVSDDKAQSKFKANQSMRASVGKVVCVGRNYAAHARELGNALPTAPMLFMKPASSIVSIHDDIVRPNPATYGDTHYETELCIQLSADLSKATIEQAKHAIGAVTVGLDLTLRDLQTELKEKGHPWERAKCFDGACVLADWIDPSVCGDFSSVCYQLIINDELKQDGDTAFMLFPVYELLANMSHAFNLQQGDVIMTGTPSGVGVLHAGDTLKLTLGENEWQTKIK